MMGMTVITCDAETFWSQDYSLSKMSTVDYVLDPRFELIMLGVKVDDEPTRIARGEKEARLLLSSIDWSRAAMLAHNTMFDAAILAWRLGVVPALYLDTLSMARGTTHAYVGSSSLDAVARYFELAPKGSQLQTYKGRWLASFTQAEFSDYSSYCVHDVDLCYAIFKRLMAAPNPFPKSELRTIDLSLRKFIEPQVKLNPLKLAEHLAEVRAEKDQALAQLSDIPKGVFSSNQQFAKLLEAEGVDVPMKLSPSTGEMTPALARNDPEFKALVDDPNQTPRVQTMLAIRLGVKSTIEETRANTLLNLSRVQWPGHPSAGCWCPVPYLYYGAHTGRFSGSGGFNFTNFKRGSPLRDAIEAPAGWMIVHRDSSQIEARMVAWLAGAEALVTAFAEGRDIYSEFASRFYGRTVTKADKKERFTGKTAILSLGYGAGWQRFQRTLYIGQGGVSVTLEDEQASDLVNLYRFLYDDIPRLWLRGRDTLDRLLGVNTSNREPVPVVIVNVDEDKLILPNGMALKYPNLRRQYDGTTGKDQLVYDVPPVGSKKIYGAKLIENISQALSRIITTEVELRVWRETGFRPFMSTYDSHDYVVPVSEVEAFDRVLETAFSVVPEWCLGLPLASEGGYGRTLLQAEQHANE